MRFGAEKRVEDFGLNRRANARAGILDSKQDHVVAMPVQSFASSLGKRLQEYEKPIQKRCELSPGPARGGADYIPDYHIKVSTTVHVIMGITPTQQFDILHIRKR